VDEVDKVGEMDEVCEVVLIVGWRLC
jgi:hypothetical protein